MANFIGATVVISLAHPPGAKVRGLIVDIKEQQLILNEVSFLHDGSRQASLAVEGSSVLDLDIEPESVLETSGPPVFTTVDPAILSYARPSTPGQVSAISQFDILSGLPPDVLHPPVSPVHSLNGSSALELAKPSAVLTEPFDDLSLEGWGNDGKSNNHDFPHDDRAQNKVNIAGKPEKLSQKAKGKHRNKQKNVGSKGNRPNEISQTNEVQKAGTDTLRQPTPRKNVGSNSRTIDSIKNHRLDDAISASPRNNSRIPDHHHHHPEILISHTGNSQPGKRNRRRKPSEFDEQNGWATGEATDIQDLGDFNFEENHKRFDKKKVFEQIRRDDTTADEERLVSFNRLPPRPGTYGGKNLHYTENVLDSPTRKLELSSDTESGADESTKTKGRFPRRVSSQASERKIPSRKGSALAGSDGQGTVPGLLPDIRELRSQRTMMEAPPSSNPSLPSDKSSAQQYKKSLRTVASDHLCRCVTPLQMLELEHLATSEFGLNDDILSENAAIAIAQTARKFANANRSKQSRKKRGPNTFPPPPLIVVLAGNHKTGSRAIAAARQLRNHDTEVVLCVMGLERQADLLDCVRRQLGIFRKCGGRIVEQNQLMETLNDLHVSNGTRSGQHLTTELIVDAMLGMHLSFDDLRMEDQTAYSQLVQWANMCDVTTVSIDMPSGVDASTGKVPEPSHIARLKAESSRTGVILQGDPGLVVEAHHVLSLGAPKIGLLLGKETVASFQSHSSWLVADIGLDESIWKKSGLCAQRGVDFGGEWVTKLEMTSISD